MKIAFLTDWCQVSPYSEFSLSLIEELHKLGNETFVLAPYPSPDRPKLRGQRDGKGVFRFYEKENVLEHDQTYVGTSTTPDEIIKQLKEWDVTHLFVHGECIKNKKTLNELVQKFAGQSFLFLHDDNYNKEINFGSFTHLLLPNRKFIQHPPGNLRISYLEQGIPEFKFDPKKIDSFRRGKNLPIPTDEGENKGYYLTTFFGKTDLKLLLQAIELVNKFYLKEIPVYLFVQCSDESKLTEFLRTYRPDPDPKKPDYLIPSFGYLPPGDLAGYFAAGDGSIFLYPPTRTKYTSSSLRFAIGAQSPIITNRGNHTVGVFEGVTVWADEILTVETIKHAIVTYFQNLPWRKRNAERVRDSLIPRLGWSAIGKQLNDQLNNRKQN